MRGLRERGIEDERVERENERERDKKLNGRFSGVCVLIWSD